MAHLSIILRARWTFAYTTLLPVVYGLSYLVNAQGCGLSVGACPGWNADTVLFSWQTITGRLWMVCRSSLPAYISAGSLQARHHW
jgi:hypothetical protein